MAETQKTPQLNSLTGALNVPRQDPKTYVFFGLTALVILAEAIAGVVYFPGKVRELYSTAQDLDTLKEEVTAREAIVTELEAVDQNQLKSQIALATSALPSEKKISGLITGLTNLASSSGIAVTELSFSPGLVSTRSGSTTQISVEPEIAGQSAEDGVRGIPISLAATANEPQLLIDFMGKIAKVSPLLGIKTLSYRVSDQNKSATFLFVIYYQPAPQALEGNQVRAIKLTEAEKETLRKIPQMTSIVTL